MKSILVPFDFSKEADKALSFALELSYSAKANLIVYHAYLEKDEAKVKSSIDSLKNNLQEIGRSDVEVMKQSLAETSLFYGALMEVATLKNVSLILTGTKGVESMFGIEEDSNSSFMIKDAHCPVLTLKSKGLTNVENILITSEFINGDNEVEFKIVKEIVQLFNSKVTFLYVDQDDKHLIGLKDIDAFAAKWDIENYSSEIIGGTTAVNAIFEVAKDIKADLVVMGYHKSRKQQHEIYGSLAADFINHTKYPVLTIHL